MSDTKEFNTNNINSENDDKKNEKTTINNSLGDTLRKKRITKRITIETIAKDLKLSESYIEAIEANDYNNLPAAPYVRVYLKSISRYLMLDPEKILQRFLEESGVSSNRIDDSKKISMDLSENSVSARFKPIYIIVIIIIFIILSFIANKDKIFSDSSITQDTTNVQVTPTDSISSEQKFYDSLQAIPADSTTDSTILSTTEKYEDTTAIKKQISKSKLSLSITSTKDSVWVQVFSDGKSWTNTIQEGKTKHFSANDSLNINVGNNAKLKYILNNKPLEVTGKGVKFFRILSNEKIYYWSSTRWKTVFAGRI